MGEVVVERFGIEKFLVYWPHIERELKTVPHIWSDLWTTESIKESTIQGQFQCWGAGDDVKLDIICWSQILYYPAGPVLCIFLAIGREVDKYIDVFDSQAEKFAHDMGCKIVQITGRPGWGAKLRKMGFKPQSTHLIKRLENWRLQ